MVCVALYSLVCFPVVVFSGYVVVSPTSGMKKWCDFMLLCYVADLYYSWGIVPVFPSCLLVFESDWFLCVSL